MPINPTGSNASSCAAWMTVLGSGEGLGYGARFPALTGEEQSLASFHGPGFSFYRLLCNFVHAGIRAPSGTVLQEADIAGSVQHLLSGKSGFDQAERRIAKISDTCLGMRLRLKIPTFPYPPLPGRFGLRPAPFRAKIHSARMSGCVDHSAEVLQGLGLSQDP